MTCRAPTAHELKIVRQKTRGMEISRYNYIHVHYRPFIKLYYLHRWCPMNWQSFFNLIPYFIAALICAGIGIYAFRRRDLPGARYFAFLAFSEFVWTLGYILQDLSPSLSGKIFWNNFQFLGATGAPLAYFGFSFAFAGRSIRKSTWRIIQALAAAVLILIWTDTLHHLFRTGSHLVSGFPFSTLVYNTGPLFILYPFFAYLLLITGTYVLISNYVSAPRAYRLQIATVLIGVIIPWIATLLTWLNLVPVMLQDITPITFAVSNLVISWGLFKHRLFDLVPVAYNTLVDNMEDGVIVLDDQKRIVDLNPASQAVLGVSINEALGKPFFSDFPIILECYP